MRPMVLLALIMALAACVPTRNPTECVWEGPVTFTLQGASADGDDVYVEGDVTWEPCNGAAATEVGTWRIDARTGDTTADAPIPTAAVPLDIDEGVDFETDEGALVVELLVSDSVSVEALAIGEVVDDAGERVAEVVVDLP